MQGGGITLVSRKGWCYECVSLQQSFPALSILAGQIPKEIGDLQKLVELGLGLN